MAERVRLGELLVDARVISRQQLEEVLDLQKRDGRRLGTLLAETGLVTETQVTQILGQQLSVPWVSLHHIDFSRQLLNLVPREVAERFCLVPIFVRRIRGIGETLYVAMDDPSDERARDEVAHFAGIPVRAMIAAPSDIRAAIRAYYARPSLSPETAASAPPIPRPAPSDAAPVLEVAEATPGEALELQGAAAEDVPEAERPTPVLSELPLSMVAAAGVLPAHGAARGDPGLASALRPAPADPLAASVAPEPARSTSLAAPLSPRGGAEDPEPDSGVPIPVREAAMPVPKRGARPRLITLTLLDGTHVTLPARAGAGSPASDPDAVTALTARDLVSALRATAHGADARDVLGESAHWEPIVAALLAVLLKKHLIADWEFVEELERMKKG